MSRAQVNEADGAEDTVTDGELVPLEGTDDTEATDVAHVGLPELGEATVAPPGGRDLRLLADIDVELSVELGRSRIALRDVLALTPGMVLELERAAGEPVDVLVNGRVVARGEVVVVDGDFGVRVNEITERP